MCDNDKNNSSFYQSHISTLYLSFFLDFPALCEILQLRLKFYLASMMGVREKKLGKFEEIQLYPRSEFGRAIRHATPVRLSPRRMT